MIGESGCDKHTNAASATNRIRATGNMNLGVDLFFAGARAELTPSSGSSARVGGEVSQGAKTRADGDIAARFAVGGTLLSWRPTWISC
jgi:hypothetical protein